MFLEIIGNNNDYTENNFIFQHDDTPPHYALLLCQLKGGPIQWSTFSKFNFIKYHEWWCCHLHNFGMHTNPRICLFYHVNVIHILLHFWLCYTFFSKVFFYYLGCCDVISETDFNTIRIMSELCRTIIKRDDEKLSDREIVSQCQKAVLETCAIDITAVLQERVILGHTTKQILDEIRSLNGSLCLKYNFGVSPWRLGVPHRITINVDASSSKIMSCFYPFVYS